MASSSNARSVLHSKLQQEIISTFLLAWSGEIELTPTARLWQNNKALSLILRWLEDGKLSFSHSILKVESADPSHLHSDDANVDDQVFREFENNGLIRIWRAKLLSLRYLTLLHQPSTIIQQDIPDKQAFDTIVSLIFNWLDQNDFTQAIVIFKRELEAVYRYQPQLFDVDLENLMTTFAKDNGRLPLTLGELL